MTDFMFTVEVTGVEKKNGGPAGAAVKDEMVVAAPTWQVALVEAAKRAVEQGEKHGVEVYGVTLMKRKDA